MVSFIHLFHFLWRFYGYMLKFIAQVVGGSFGLLRRVQWCLLMGALPAYRWGFQGGPL
jgi:hypothetical protein